MRDSTRTGILGIAMLGVALTTVAIAADAPAVPFKLGTFSAGTRTYLGLVLDDTRVIDISAANAAYERSNRAAAKLNVPADMRSLIERYDADVGPRLRELARMAAADAAASYAQPVAKLRVEPPVRPSVILNAGANYPEHARGIVEQAAREGARVAAGSGVPAPNTQAGGAPAAARPPAQSAPGYWERPAGDTRPDNPYLFLKSPTAVVGAHDDVVIPRGRVQIDWECEFTVVLGRKAKNVSVADAPNYVFGYSIEFDVSDRGGRGDRKMGGGPDWLVQKNHDTFAPIGPYIVPKEFFPQPMKARHYFSLNGEIKQDSNTSRMEYNIWEMVSYASNMMTLSPGDLIAAGSPAGTNIERENPRWMRAGDEGVCVIEGIGEQRHRIVAQP
jgi:2-keto-4-pentenoate hydratase/2-oxohepta-3-ene-1,7-dioic acid hydratase in catechol pathway